MSVGKVLLLIVLLLCGVAALGYSLFVFGGPFSDDGWNLQRWMRNDGHLAGGVLLIFLVAIGAVIRRSR